MVEKEAKSIDLDKKKAQVKSLKREEIPRSTYHSDARAGAT